MKTYRNEEEFSEVYRIVTQNTFINGMDAYSYLGYQNVSSHSFRKFFATDIYVKNCQNSQMYL